jgi:hypothetical protein
MEELLKEILSELKAIKKMMVEQKEFNKENYLRSLEQEQEHKKKIGEFVKGIYPGFPDIFGR